MWIIVFSIIAVMVITLAATHFFGSKNSSLSEETSAQDADVECCGVHEVCDKDTLLSSSDQIVYYQDEELDNYKHVSPSQYSPKQIEEFREILYTMNDDEVAGWLRSLQLRAINPPHAVREEALMIVAEVREIIKTSRQSV